MDNLSSRGLIDRLQKQVDYYEGLLDFLGDTIPNLDAVVEQYREDRLWEQ